MSTQEQRAAAVITAFKGRSGNGGSRLDLTTFTHRRLRRGTHEGDACEVGYQLLDHRGDDGVRGMDLVPAARARASTTTPSGAA